ncbi:MAG TPA: phosphatidylglycerol lysyltransferase domain-containing protein [Enhygromyxa sp.]|nr:phosphatidylglycerol lysyltransferase domain-containing protein [Enhygromyxa sp.]
MKSWIRDYAAGDLIAASTLQPGLQWFETSFGAWAYASVDGFDVTLGGPLCAPTDRAEMIRRFLARSRRPILFYLREDLLELLEPTRLRCAGIGVDRHVDIPTLLANPHPTVRGALKKARRAGFRMRPIELAQLDPDARAQLQRISARYLAHAQVRMEMAFLNWPMSYTDAGPRRVYALEKFDREHQGTFGFAVLNPIFDRGQRTGYLLDILRFEPTKLWGVWLATVHTLARELGERGEQLSLGFAPLHRVRPAPHAGSRTLQAQFDWMVRYLSTAQYLQRLRELKDAIPGREEQRYVASYTRSAPTILRAFLRAMNVRFGPMFVPRLLEVISEGVRTQVRDKLPGWASSGTSRTG